MLSEHGFFCGNIDCMSPLSIASVAVQLDLQLRRFIAKLYEAWLVCDESTCGNRTRMMSVYGKRCLVAGCRGAMHPEVRLSGFKTLLRGTAAHTSTGAR